MTTSTPTAKVQCLCGQHAWNFRLGCWVSIDANGVKLSAFRDHGVPPCAPGAKRSRTPNQHLRILQPPRQTRIG